MQFDKSPENGHAASKTFNFMKSSIFWGSFAEFFPITLHKVVDLKPAFLQAGQEPLTPTIKAYKKRHSWETETRDQLNFYEDSNSTIVSSSNSDSEVDSDDCTETEFSYSGQSFADPKATEDSGSLKIIQNSTEFPHRTLLETLKEVYKYVTLLLHLQANESENPALERTGNQYIFGYHPHGIIGMGAMGGIATEGAHWSKMFPGIPVSLLTLANQFQVPLYREYLLGLGLACASRRSCTSLLSKGQSICIVLGGAQESLLARPGAMDLVLNKRKGFVKLAMSVPKTSLVPIIGFGENDLYDQVSNLPTSRLFKVQTFLKNKLGFTLPLIYARGIFTYDFGIIPYRRPINLVVGRPIEIPAIEHPSEAQVNYYHGLYMEGIKELFDAHKEQFHKDHTSQTPECIYYPLNIVA